VLCSKDFVLMIREFLLMRGE